jgi:hypothetical protein
MEELQRKKMPLLVLVLIKDGQKAEFFISIRLMSLLGTWPNQINCKCPGTPAIPVFFASNGTESDGMTKHVIPESFNEDMRPVTPVLCNSFLCISKS